VSDPELSIVVPAYNEELRLPRTLERLQAFLRTFPRSSEIVVVDDGSTDGTVAVAEAAGVRVERYGENRGKGFAVRRGMLAARGEVRLMTDADLSTPIEELPRLMGKLGEGYDVVIGSRALPGASIEVRQSAFREGTGRVFNTLVQWIVVRGLQDTQCGFKLFTKAAAVESFSAARLDGFCFDVEVLFIATRRGYRIAEVPVVWRNDAATRVSALRGGLAFLDILRIRWNAVRGLYAP
jgi:glycosyltransferase involved in cell wall biosynthesis